MGVHIVDRIVGTDTDANGHKEWFFLLEQEDNGYRDRSPGWASNPMKDLVDAAVNAQTRSSFDNAVSNLLPSGVSSWYSGKGTADKDGLWTSTKELATVR